MAEKKSKITAKEKMGISSRQKKRAQTALEDNSEKIGTAKKAEIKKTAEQHLDKTNSAKEIDPWAVLLYPHMAEKSMSLVDIQNKLVFVVRRDSKKPQIKEAFQKLFDVKVESVKTETTIDGKKKAFIKLHPDNSAADIATRLGIL